MLSVHSFSTHVITITFNKNLMCVVQETVYCMHTYMCMYLEFWLPMFLAHVLSVSTYLLRTRAVGLRPLRQKGN